MITRIDQGAAPSADARARAAFFGRPVLAVYDALVLGVSCRFVWKCPAPSLLDWYNAHASANHLDVGVGTGYFLDRCRFPSATPRIVLADLSESSLRATARRLRRFHPKVYEVDVLAPFEMPEKRFDSIGLNFLLHCLPGTLREKAIVFDHLRPLLNRGGVLFGATLLAAGVDRSWLARAAMANYNGARILGNAHDTLTDLEAALRSRFSRVDLRTVGCVALFSAHATLGLTRKQGADPPLPIADSERACRSSGSSPRACQGHPCAVTEARARPGAPRRSGRPPPR